MNPRWNSIADLSTYKIGATTGYSFGEEFDNADATGLINVQRTTADVQSLKMLFLDRLDMIVIEKSVANYLMTTLYTGVQREKFVFHAKSVNDRNLYLLFSKKSIGSEEYLRRFNAGLKLLHESGEYEEIFTRRDFFIEN